MYFPLFHIKSFFTTEFRNLSPEIRKGSTLRKMVFVVATISCSSFGIIAAFQLFLSPCTPPYVVSMRTKCLNPGSSQTEEIDFFVVMAILLDASMYFHVGPVAALMIASFLMGFGACLQEYLTVISEYVITFSNILGVFITSIAIET